MPRRNYALPLRNDPDCAPCRAAVEAYPANMVPFAPPEYEISGCGEILVWTKR